MSMRIFEGITGCRAPAVASALVALAACHRPQPASTQDIPDAQALPRFACATGAAPLRPDCSAERTRSDRGWIVTLRHPDGHFRRLLAKDDGSVAAADGAEPAHVTHSGGEVEVAIGPDRYRLPAAP